MKKTLILVFWGYLLLLFQTSWGPVFQWGLVRLNGLVPLVVWYGFGVPMPGGLLAALALGVLCEPFSSIPGGLYIVAFSGAYLLVRYIHDHTIFLVLWQRCLVAVFVSIGVQTVLLLGSRAMDLLWPWALIQAALDGLTYPLWSRLFDYTEKIIAKMYPESGSRARL